MRGDYIAALITAVAVGLLDWYVIPAMGFSESLRNLGVASEPFLGAAGVVDHPRSEEVVMVAG